MRLVCARRFSCPQGSTAALQPLGAALGGGGGHPDPPPPQQGLPLTATSLCPPAAGGLCRLQIRAACGRSSSIQRQVSSGVIRGEVGVPHMAQHGSCSLRTGPGTAWHSQIRAPWAVGGGQGEQQRTHPQGQ